MSLSTAAPATVTGEVADSHWCEPPGRLDRPTEPACSDIRKPGDLPATTDVAGRGVPVSGDGPSRDPPSDPRPIETWDRDVTEPPVLEPVELLVCVKCRRGLENPDGVDRPGAILHEALRAQGVPAGVKLTPVECLSNCSQGCTIALRGPGRWTYVFGNLDEAVHPGTILEGTVRYHATPNGLVPWRERPEHFRKNCIARVPPMEAIDV